MKTLSISLVIIAGIVVFVACLYADQQPPAVTIGPAAPNTIYVGSSTSVTISVLVSDSRVIPSGVDLLQVDPIHGTQRMVGSLSASGPQTFTIIIQPPTSSPILLNYQVSAAFRGLLKRSLSPIVSLAVAPVGMNLPPDPGPAGLQTLAGIDSDNDGVRDDIERWIDVTEPTSTPLRLALAQQAKGIQSAILSNGNQQQAITAMNAESDALMCLDGWLGDDVKAASALSDELHSISLNTTARIAAYLTANSLSSGSAYGLPPVGTSTCH